LFKQLQSAAIAADSVLIRVHPGSFIAEAQEILEGALLVVTQTVVMY
jgi:hypothetical protein